MFLCRRVETGGNFGVTSEISLNTWNNTPPFNEQDGCDQIHLFQRYWPPLILIQQGIYSIFAICGCISRVKIFYSVVDFFVIIGPPTAIKNRPTKRCLNCCLAWL
nr:unnamed protein product [Callosobruchus analis]